MVSFIVWDKRTRWQIRYSSADNLDDVTPPGIELVRVRFLFYDQSIMNEWSKTVSERGDEKRHVKIRDEGIYLPTGEKEYREPRYLYHTLLHTPSPSTSVDFFGQKSKATLERARIYRVTSEIQKMVSSDKVYDWTRLLNEYGYYKNANPLSDESREEIAERVRIFFQTSGFDELDRFVAEDDFHLFDIESQVSALMNKEVEPIPFEKLAQMEKLRSTSYYLARTIEIGGVFLRWIMKDSFKTVFAYTKRI